MIYDGSNLSKVRLRVGDFSDLPILPDAVYEGALIDCNQYLPKAALLCAQYILAMLTSKTHKKMMQLEVWNDGYFDNYLAFLKTTLLNPNFMDIAPIPYLSQNSDIALTMLNFRSDWNQNWVQGTSDQNLHMTAYSYSGATFPNPYGL